MSFGEGMGHHMLRNGGIFGLHGRGTVAMAAWIVACR